MKKTMKTKKESTTGRTASNRPMPTDPKDLARAMFRQADQRTFGNRSKEKNNATPKLRGTRRPG